MKKRFTEEQLRAKIKKAPLWIQDIANAALAERDTALKKLAEHYEHQEPTPFYVKDYGSGGKHYIKAWRLIVDHGGIELTIDISPNNMRDGKGIELHYCGSDESNEDIAIIPKSHNCIELRAPENLRSYKLSRKTKQQ